MGVTCQKSGFPKHLFRFIRASPEVMHALMRTMAVPMRSIVGAPPDGGKVFGGFSSGVRNATIEEGKIWQGGKAREMKRSLFSIVQSLSVTRFQVSRWQSSQGGIAMPHACNNRIKAFAFGSLGRLTAARRAAPYAWR